MDFLLACLRACLEEGQFGLPAWAEGLDARRLLQLAINHRGFGLLYRLGKEHPGLWPESFQFELKALRTQNLLRGDQAVQEVKHVLGGLREAGIPAVVLKGWAYIPTVYGGDYSLRAYADVDLLVSPEHAGRAGEVLMELGYHTPPEMWPGFRERYSYCEASYHSAQAGSRFGVDLHWGLFNRPYHDERIRIHEVMGRAKALSAAGEGALRLCAEDDLLFACGHLTVRHRYEEDLFRYFEAAWNLRHAAGEVDWEAALARAREWKLTIPLRFFVPRIEEVFPGTIPQRAVTALGEEKPGKGEEKTHRWLVKHAASPLCYCRPARWTPASAWRGARLLLEVLFPGPEYLRWRYGEGKSWHFAILRRVFQLSAKRKQF